MSDSLTYAVVEAARELPAQHAEALATALDGLSSSSAAGARARLAAVVPAAGFATVAGRVFEAWARDMPEAPGSAVALALRGVARALEEERDRRSIEIVWTGPTTPEVPVRTTLSALIDVVRAAQQQLTIVSFAAYKVDDLIQELVRAADRGVAISLILETDKAGGGTLTFAAKAAFDALEGRASLFAWPAEKRPQLEKGRASMHAKAAVADEHTALVTSANFTGHAIGSNMELGLLVRGGSVPRRLAGHFRELIRNDVLERVAL